MKDKNLKQEVAESCEIVNSVVNDSSKPADVYPGVAVDNSDGEKVSELMVDDRTKSLNNNPRNAK